MVFPMSPEGAKTFARMMGAYSVTFIIVFVGGSIIALNQSPFTDADRQAAIEQECYMADTMGKPDLSQPLCTPEEFERAGSTAATSHNIDIMVGCAGAGFILALIAFVIYPMWRSRCEKIRGQNHLPRTQTF